MPKYEKRLFIAMGLCVVVLIIFLYAWPARRVTLYVAMGVMLTLMVLKTALSWPDIKRDLPWLSGGRVSDEIAEKVSFLDRAMAVTALLVSILTIGVVVYGIVFMLTAFASNEKALRRVEARHETLLYEDACYRVLMDAEVRSFYAFFDDVDAAVKAYGGYQDLWNAVIPALLREGGNADLEHVKPDLLKQLDSGYVEELKLDPWGHPYQFYVPRTRDEGQKPVHVWSMGPDGVSSWRPDDAVREPSPEFSGDDITPDRCEKESP